MSKPKTATPEFVTNDEIAKIFGVSIHAVRAWRSKLPAYAFGNVRRYVDVEKAVTKIRDDMRTNKGMLTKKEVFDIYKRREVKKQSLAEIAETYGRTASAVSKIARGIQYPEYWQEYHN